MIENITFENFRGFRKMELTGLKPITLVSGKNNAGKSTVLEGMFLFLDHLAPDSFTKINRFRGVMSLTESVDLWESVFYEMDTTKTMKISITDAGESRSLKYTRDDTFVPSNDVNVSQEMMEQIISSAKSMYTLQFKYERNEYVEEGHFMVSPMGILRSMSTILDYNQMDSMPFTQFINMAMLNGNSENFIAERLGRLELEGKKQQVVEVLKLIEPSIEDISTIVVGGQARLYVKTGRQLLLLRLAGDGLNKLLFIILSIMGNRRSVLLIDEIETGFHYSMLPKLWETVAQAAYESECQIIATTHSYECIASAMEGIEKAKRSSDFCYYRLDKNETGNRAYRYSDDLLQTAIATDMEVR